MTAVILTIHTLIVLGLIVVVLLQRSDGGALGLGGGGGGGGGFMSGRGAANALTRTTSVLAALFFATSLGLAIYAGSGENEEAVIEGLTGQSAPDPDAEISAPSTDDLLQTLGGDSDSTEADTGAVEVPLTEQEILDSLGTEPAQSESPDLGSPDAPAGDDTDETPETSEQPDQ
ncbi:MAG: preprotein translocase subunit SecG [Pseudomonadota bacterium]